MKGSATSYTWPVTASVLLHGALLAFIVVGWTPAEKPRKVVTPKYIEAKLLQMAPVAAQPEAPPAQPPPQPKAEEPKVDTAAEERRKQQEQQRQEQERQEAVKKEQARQEQLRREQETKAKAAAEQKRKEEQARAEAERQKKEAQAKAEAERKRQEELKRQQELKRQEEIKRQQAEKQRQEQLRREQELARALAAADAELGAEQVGSYIGYIQDRIGANWSRPPSARLGMVTELEITLDGQARVLSVAVVKSSGNAAFDLSAEQAVRRAGQFERLRELIQQDRAAYEQNFRRFRLKFNPQDLRL
jgi:colicin import membrane protein